MAGITPITRVSGNIERGTSIPIEVQGTEANRIWSENTTERIQYQIATRARFGGVGTLVKAESDLPFTAKNKYLFPTPSMPQFANTKNVQLTLNQGSMDKIAQQFNNIKDSYVDELLRSVAEKTPVDTGRARAGWQRNGDDIINPVPYVKYLEVGTPNTRPIAMVASTLANSQRILDRIVSRYLKF